MPRKKKSDVEVLVNIIEDGQLTTIDLQWINRIVARKLRNREVFPDSKLDFPKEAKDASEKRSAKAASGGGPGKASSGAKDRDGYVGPKSEEVR